MKYYCIGIKGTGMSTLAQILNDLGNEVSGYRETNPGEDHLFFRNCDEALFGHHAVDSVSRRRMPEAESGNQMR